MGHLPAYKELFDKVHNYYMQDYELQPKELEIAERWELAFALLCEHRQKKVAATYLIRICKKKGKGISIAQAYKDIQSAEKVFAPIKQYSREFLKLTIIESAVRDIKHAESRARKASTTKDWATCMHVKDKAASRLILVSGINDDLADIPDFTKLEPHQYDIGIPDDLLLMLQKISGKGVIDATELINMAAHDIDHEEVK